MKNKSIFISGATGSFGTSFIDSIINNKEYDRIVVYSRDEFKQYNLKKSFETSINKDKLRFFLGDVRDKERLKLALNNIDIVIHAAALKQVDTLEYNPFEAVKTNIIGTQNLIDVSLEKNIKKFLAISTDKSVSPVNLYGGSKFVAEKLVLAANNYKGQHKCNFSCVRYGNVFGSRGSVIPLFLEQNKKNNFFTITDKKMTRFSMTLDQSVKFVLKCLAEMQGNEIFIPKLPSYRVVDLANAVNSEKKIKVVGLRPGEKIDETLISKEELSYCHEFKDYYVVFNCLLDFNEIKKRYKSKKINLSLKSQYDSKNNLTFLNKEEIKKLIKDYISQY